MYKLNNQMINLMINNRISSKSIDFILLTRSMNELGQANDIHYKEVCNELNISKQTFYDIVYKLDELNIVKPNYQNKCTWDFTFDESSKDSYLNTNKEFLYNNEFRILKSTEKLMILKFLILTRRNSFQISFDKLKRKYNIKCDSIMLSYLNTMKKYFNVTKKSEHSTIYIFSKKKL